jgi:hypothetical protein
VTWKLMWTIVRQEPTDKFAAVFTKNAFPGAPVIVGRKRLAEPKISAIVVNNKVPPPSSAYRPPTGSGPFRPDRWCDGKDLERVPGRWRRRLRRGRRGEGVRGAGEGAGPPHRGHDHPQLHGRHRLAATLPGCDRRAGEVLRPWEGAQCVCVLLMMSLSKRPG